VEAIESSPGAIPGADEEMAATTYQKGGFFSGTMVILLWKMVI